MKGYFGSDFKQGIIQTVFTDTRWDSENPVQALLQQGSFKGEL